MQAILSFRVPVIHAGRRKILTNQLIEFIVAQPPINFPGAECY